MNATEERPAIADMVSFIEDDTSPMKCMKRRDVVEESAGLGLGGSVVRCDDDGSKGEVLWRDVVSLGAMEDKRSMPAGALENVDPLANEHGGKDNESTFAEVGDDEPDG